VAYGASVSLKLDVELMQIDHDQATPLALLINEVMTNALKYAFADRSDGILAL
jgi:two-component sensor histidine kinase